MCDNGMPPNSYTLVFDGNPLPDLSSQIFEIVREEAAWQDALDEWRKLHQIVPTFEERRQHACYHSERFPYAVRDIVRGKSLIRCNFAIDGQGGPWNAKEVLAMNRGLMTAEEWEDKWEEQRLALTFQTTAPLPTWIELRLSRLLPEEEREIAKSTIVKGRDYF